MMKLPRLYIDTSVFGGCFDEEFAVDSRRLVDACKTGKAILVLSDTTLGEVLKAPPAVSALLQAIPQAFMEVLPRVAGVEELRDAYLSANILGRQFRNDAAHVAYATIFRVDAIVSWNFKHLVRFDKIRNFNQANLQLGYGLIQIVSPKEVLFDE